LVNRKHFDRNRKYAEGGVFYWVTIMFSQTLGTALGDWVAETHDMGYVGAGAVFGGLLLVTALLYYFTSISRVIFVLGSLHLDSPARSRRR